MSSESKSKLARRLVLAALTVALCVMSFGAGRWVGDLRCSLTAESSYPWDLEKHLNTNPVGCDTLRTQRVGDFAVTALDGGRLLRVVTYDATHRTLTASVIDGAQRRALATWEETNCTTEGGEK